MAKALSKFATAYAKLQPELKGFTETERSNRSTRLNTAWATLSQGEHNLSDSMVTARKAGVTGSALTDFAKNKDFKEALGLLGIAAKQMEDDAASIKKWCDKAQDHVSTLTKLLADIDKDLKSRKDKSESKDDISTLRDDVAAKLKELTKLAGFHATLPPGKRSYDITKGVNNLLKKAPDAQKSQMDERMLPHKLVDRNRKAAVSKAATLAKDVKASCDTAIETAGDDSKSAAEAMKLAMGKLKEAQPKLAELKALHDEFKEAYDFAKKKDTLAGTKDEKAVDEAMKTIANAYAIAERSFRGAATTMKKAQG